MKDICPSLKSAFLRFATSTPSGALDQAADKFAASLSSAPAESPEHMPLYRELRSQGLSMQEAKHAVLFYLQLKQTAAEDLLRRIDPKAPVRPSKRVRSGSSEDEEKLKKKRKS